MANPSRRGFLAGLGAVVVAPALPAAPATGSLTVAHLLKAKAMLVRNDAALATSYGMSPARYALRDMVELNGRLYSLLASGAGSDHLRSRPIPE